MLLDIDGTLLDSNDAHAAAWVDGGREFGYRCAAPPRAIYDDPAELLARYGYRCLACEAQFSTFCPGTAAYLYRCTPDNRTGRRAGVVDLT